MGLINSAPGCKCLPILICLVLVVTIFLFFKQTSATIRGHLAACKSKENMQAKLEAQRTAKDMDENDSEGEGKIEKGGSTASLSHIPVHTSEWRT